VANALSLPIGGPGSSRDPSGRGRRRDQWYRNASPRSRRLSEPPLHDVSWQVVVEPSTYDRHSWDR